MQKIKITNKVLEQKIKEYARKHKISFQKACAKLFDKGVCHLQKKDIKSNVFISPKSRNTFCMGVCHPR